LVTASQEQVDRVCAAMAAAALMLLNVWAFMAHQETGYGVPEHKHLKNEFASRNVWESIKDLKTVGIVGMMSKNGSMILPGRWA
jgi:acetaldehyde dehydrogenase (acetylating)